MVFQYPTPRVAKVQRRNPIIEAPPKKPKEIMGLIQGKTPRSIEEWRVYVALMRYEIEFRYQVPIMGGGLVRGGQILDYLIYNPFPEPWQIYGEYWHRAQMNNQDRFKLAILLQIFGVEPTIFWGSELQTQEDTFIRVREELGL